MTKKTKINNLSVLQLKTRLQDTIAKNQQGSLYYRHLAERYLVLTGNDVRIKSTKLSQRQIEALIAQTEEIRKKEIEKAKRRLTQQRKKQKEQKDNLTAQQIKEKDGQNEKRTVKKKNRNSEDAESKVSNRRKKTK